MSARTIDVKLSFDRFDGIAGPACRIFRRNLLQCGGRADDRGYSIADTLLRQDEGALVSGTGVNGIPPMAQPGVVPIAGGVGGTSARRAKSRRDKESATFILMHLDNEDLKDELSQPQFLQNGAEIFDHIMATCLQPLTAAEEMEVKTELSQMSVKHTVGSSENSVNLLLQALP